VAENSGQKENITWARGRRKTSVARVRLARWQWKKISINGRSLSKNSSRKTKTAMPWLVRFVVTEMRNRLEHDRQGPRGAAFTGQAGAICQGVGARAQGHVWVWAPLLKPIAKPGAGMAKILRGLRLF